MLEDLTAACEACDRPLADPAIVHRTATGERRAYECTCGEVTVTVVRSGG